MVQTSRCSYNVVVAQLTDSLLSINGIFNTLVAHSCCRMSSRLRKEKVLKNSSLSYLFFQLKIKLFWGKRKLRTKFAFSRKDTHSRFVFLSLLKKLIQILLPFVGENCNKEIKVTRLYRKQEA